VDWAGDVLGQSPGAEDRDTLVQVGQAFLEEGSKAGSRGDDGQLEELVTSSFPDGTILIFTAADIDKRKKIFKTLESRAQVILCAAREDKQRAGLDRSFFEERVEKFLKPAGKRIRAEALDEMYARAGKNLRQLHSEIAKLVGYVGQREEIIREDVERVFMDFHEVAFFELNRVLRTGDRGQCLTALQENLKIVSHPLQTLATIANEFRKIMVARELLFTIFRQSWKPGISFNNFKPILGQVREAHPDLMKTGKFKLLAMNDYALYFLLNDAQRFPMYKLIRIMECVLEADLMMKSTRVGSRSPELILEDLVLSICHPTTLSPQ
jgi:DNA polymerase-3 subunit delta